MNITKPLRDSRKGAKLAKAFFNHKAAVLIVNHNADEVLDSREDYF
jgi:hypothetical protein